MASPAKAEGTMAYVRSASMHMERPDFSWLLIGTGVTETAPEKRWLCRLD